MLTIKEIDAVKQTEENYFTKLLYLNNTYQFEESAKVLNVGRSDKGGFIILDETLFHPQGGGQPSDQGLLTINNKTYIVEHVSYINGKVYHFVNENTDEITEHSFAHMQINPEKRIINAKCHTAGHVLAAVIEKIMPELRAFKGYHFPDGSYVEFEGTLEPTLFEGLAKQADEQMADLIHIGTKATCHEIEPNTLTRNKSLVPEGKKARALVIDGIEAVPCGGTHISNLSELKFIKIRKIQKNKGNIKIRYTFL